MTTKCCKKCGVEKSLTDFYVCRSNRDKRAGKCKTCILQERRDSRGYAEYLEKERKRGTKRYSSVRGRALLLLRRAKESPDGCSITLEHVIRGIETGRCAVTGIAFDLTNDHQRISGRTRNPYAPSIDRISPHFGYTPENTRIVIWQYNAMKGEISDDEVAFICEQILAGRRRAA